MLDGAGVDGAGGALARALGAASSDPTPITYPTLWAIEDRLKALQEAHPDLVELWNAKDKYSIQPKDCPSREDPDKGVLCPQTFIRLTNFTSGGEEWMAQSPTIKERPQVFFSGNLHGDEVVGPATLITLAEMLVACSDPRSKDFNPWVARMLNTRVIVMVVVSNPWGFARASRLDAEGDPNRDFPYSRKKDKNCLITGTAKGINAAWKEHLFQLAITFHGGMESITYEWGSMENTGPAVVSPDDEAQKSLAETMGKMAGKFNNHLYVVGRTNDVVYPVEGGMEDWAYAGEWRHFFSFPLSPFFFFSPFCNPLILFPPPPFISSLSHAPFPPPPTPTLPLPPPVRLLGPRDGRLPQFSGGNHVP